MRSWFVSSLVLIAATAGLAHADPPPADSLKLTLKTPSDPAFASEDEDASRFTAPNDDDRPRQFNLARCLCDRSGSPQNVLLQAEWATAGGPTPAPDGVVEVWVGSGCATGTAEMRDMQCSEVANVPDVAQFNDGENFFIGVGEILTPGTTFDECSADLSTVTIGTYSVTNDMLTKVTELEQLTVDMKAPPLPASVEVTAQEGQIELSWDPITAEGGDVQYFQALCSRADGTNAHAGNGTHDARYDTAFLLCGASGGLTIEALSVTNAASPGDLPVSEMDLAMGMRELRDTFICGQSAGGATARGIELEGLDNEVAYEVILLSVDKAGNVSAGYVPRTVAPKPVTDFWEDVNNDDANLEGGLCLIESTFGAGGGGGLYGALRAWRDELATTAAGRWLVARYYAWGAPIAAAAQESIVVRVAVGLALLPLIAVALVWHALGLPLLLALIAGLVLWRRRRRAVLAVAALLAAPSLAAAQSNTPYWDDSFAGDEDAVTGPKWHFGIRLGPFLPSIDESGALDSRPYERMFGGDAAWTPSFDLHRVVTTRFGQFGAGLSFGFFGKTADSWEPAADPMTLPTDRAPGNDTSLRIIPIEATAIYRLSQLDDNWGIPLVPYARGGLAYSLWWVRRPDGELSKACDGTMDTCDRGIGASAGLVGAVGLAIRGERIDADAARSMRDSGLDHAGFYAEISTSWVNGFGSDKKLSLGDTTWSAGVDFEF